MLSWLAPVLVFGLVVLVHEAGHFVAAKLIGVYAPRFSIGFGRPLWRRRRGETEYVIGWLPIGGYVRMASREDEATAFLEGGSEMSTVPAVGASSSPTVAEGSSGVTRQRDWDPEAMVPFGPKPVPPDRWFESKPLWARLVIMLAGVTMNVVLALLVSTGLFAVYGRPFVPAVIDSVVAGRPAEKAGLQRGDSIVTVNGKPVRRWTDVTVEINRSAGQPVELEIVRGGRQMPITVTPEPVADTNLVTGRPQQVGKIGAASRVSQRERLTPVGSLVAGWNATASMGNTVLQVIWGLLTGQVSVTQLGGPIQIARSSVEAARSGVAVLFQLIAFLSVNIAILNLLPIPILDGGQILLNVAEAIKGSAFSARTREYILRAGLLAIALLFAIVMFNDIKGLVKPF